MVDYVKDIFYCFICSKCGGTGGLPGIRELKDAIQAMRQQGWKVGKEKNTCPSCQQK